MQAPPVERPSHRLKSYARLNPVPCRPYSAHSNLKLSITAERRIFDDDRGSHSKELPSMMRERTSSAAYDRTRAACGLGGRLPTDSSNRMETTRSHCAEQTCRLGMRTQGDRIAVLYSGGIEHGCNFSVCISENGASLHTGRTRQNPLSHTVHHCLAQGRSFPALLTQLLAHLSQQADVCPNTDAGNPGMH